MPKYRTPGVHFEWLDSAPAIRARRTDIAGFVGICVRGPLHFPVKVSSWDQFRTTFGAHTPQGFLAYAVEGFFGNGGVECWVVRAADPDTAATATFRIRAGLPDRELLLEAASPGSWARELRIRTTAIGTDRLSLAFQLPSGEREFWPNLALDPASPRFFGAVLGDPVTGSNLIRMAVRTDLQEPADGLATLQPWHLSGRNVPGDRGTARFGLAALEPIDDVAIVAIPDIMPVLRRLPQRRQPPARCDVLDAEPVPPQFEPAEPEFPPAFTPLQISELQHALIGHCEQLRDRFAILDTRREDRVPEDVLTFRLDLSSTYAALYCPWISVADPLALEGALRLMPPSGHIAGVYARVDRSFGVHRPPANQEILGAQDVRVAISDIQHGILNDASINALRLFAGRGVRVYGARTLASPDNRQWLYVNVRRLISMIEEAIEESTQWMVFEPNDATLWGEIDRVVRNLLDSLWQAGMLDGASPEEAFSVRCDAATNTPEQTDAGRVICDIGLQPPWPAEFVVVRVGMTAAGVQILNLMEAQNV